MLIDFNLFFIFLSACFFLALSLVKTKARHIFKRKNRKKESNQKGRELGVVKVFSKLFLLAINDATELRSLLSKKNLLKPAGLDLDNACALACVYLPTFACFFYVSFKNVFFALLPQASALTDCKEMRTTGQVLQLRCNFCHCFFSTSEENKMVCQSASVLFYWLVLVCGRGWAVWLLNIMWL